MIRQENLSTRFSGLFSELKPDDDGVIRFKQVYEKQPLIFEVGQVEQLGDYIKVRLDMATEPQAEERHEQPLLVEYSEQAEPSFRFYNKAYMPRHFFHEASVVLPALISQVEQRHEYVKSLEDPNV